MLCLFSVQGLVVDFGYLKLTTVVVIVHSFCDSWWVSLCAALSWFFFLRILVGKNFSPLMIQESAFCPGHPQHSQIIICMTFRDEITVDRYPESALILILKG